MCRSKRAKHRLPLQSRGCNQVFLNLSLVFRFSAEMIQQLFLRLKINGAEHLNLLIGVPFRLPLEGSA